MLKTQNEKMAHEFARDRGERVGFCVADGLYYVGSLMLLRQLPMIIQEERGFYDNQ